MRRGRMTIVNLSQPYLLFLGDTREAHFAKTAFGIRDWAPNRCVGEWRLPGCEITAGLPVMDPVEAFQNGARALVIGVAHPGGGSRAGWVDAFRRALAAGLDIIGGMHERLADATLLSGYAESSRQKLIDIRTPPSNIPLATGKPRRGKRLLTIGTDCAVGKKYTALALTRAFGQAGIDADFRATGQTGILIAGSGIPLDAVVSDFLAGAAEMLTPEAEDTHWDIIEGQGSLAHPAYAGVSLGLLHGSQPDILVACHEPGRDRMLGFETFATEPLDETIENAVRHARRVNPRARCAGISLNTARFDEQEAEKICEEHTDRLGMPCADPVRGGRAFERLVEACLKEGQPCQPA